MHFLEWRWSNSDSNGLAPNRRQAITWTNDGPVHWRIYAAIGGDELRNQTDVSGLVTTLRPKLNREIFQFSVEFHWSLFPTVPTGVTSSLAQVMACHEQATSRYLNQWYLSWLTHICEISECILNERDWITFICYCIIFRGVQLILRNHWFDNGFVPNKLPDTVDSSHTAVITQNNFDQTMKI